MRSQILTKENSSQSEKSKISILVNELNRRLLMLDEKVTAEERISIVDHFTQQLWNSGYKEVQIREIILSSLKGTIRKEERQKMEGKKRYRTAQETLPERMRKKLLEKCSWYKEDDDKKGDDVDYLEVDHLKASKPWNLYPKRKRNENTKIQIKKKIRRNSEQSMGS